jgi:hypothetical protein
MSESVRTAFRAAATGKWVRAVGVARGRGGEGYVESLATKQK